MSLACGQKDECIVDVAGSSGWRFNFPGSIAIFAEIIDEWECSNSSYYDIEELLLGQMARCRLLCWLYEPPMRR